MRPIEHRTDAAFAQALRCVSFRVPVTQEFKENAFALALGLRYGLIGVAAADYLLLSCPDREEQTLTRQLHVYGSLVREHVQTEVLPRLGRSVATDLASRISLLACEPLEQFLPMYRRLCPLELCLSVLSDRYTQIHRQDVTAGAGLFRRAAARRLFQAQADQSYLYALCFFERRQLNLEEVREIALIGE